MTFIAVITALAALVWAAVLVRRGSVLLGCAFFLVVGYVFGYELVHFQAGPVPLTFDRLVLVGLVVAFVWQWRTGRLDIQPFTREDWLLFIFVGLMTASVVLHPRPEGTPDGGSPIWRLVASFWMPLILYSIAKSSLVDRRELRAWTAIVGCLGIYLAVTAIAEVTAQWWAVFPRYIADPKLGTHFGRARGPTLMAASMGIYLTFGALVLWHRWNDAARTVRLALLTLLPFFAVAIFFTYTRSAWLGAAGAALVVMMFEFRGAWRPLALTGAIVASLFVVAVKWDNIMSFKRDAGNTAGDALHSVQQRASFTYVSWQMFKDRPMFGCGFGRYYDQKLPYLSDRRQQVELESIRQLQHHNTVLSILTETGIVGAFLFIALFASFVKTGWQVARAAEAPDWARRFGVLMLAAIVTYLGSALFHDLSLSPTEHWALFTFAGITASLHGTFVKTPSPVREPSIAANSAGCSPSGLSVAT